MQLTGHTRVNSFLKSLMVVLACCSWALAAQPTIESIWAETDVTLDTNPASVFWRAAVPVYMESDAHGNPVPNYRTEVRTRWTKQNLYFLFICPYEQLNLKPNPHTSTETNQLWNWDVAEVFIGTNFENIHLYKEFEMSPQGEWVDLDIDSAHMGNEKAWLWNSGFEVKARIDADKKIWYGEMRIPIKSLDDRPAAAGIEMRINLYRCQGAGPNRKYIAWQPTHTRTFHTPEAFGRLRMAE